MVEIRIIFFPETVVKNLAQIGILHFLHEAATATAKVTSI